MHIVSVLDRQYAEVTDTSDRLCSICSTCPAEYTTTPCTPTSDSSCIKAKLLSPGSVAAIVLAIVLVFGVGAVFSTALYREKERKHAALHKTQNYLELTERLLGDEREENVRMNRAFSIPEEDLTLGETLGVGAFGRVVRGMWGYVDHVSVLRLYSTILYFSPLRLQP